MNAADFLEAPVDAPTKAQDFLEAPDESTSPDADKLSARLKADQAAPVLPTPGLGGQIWQGLTNPVSLSEMKEDVMRPLPGIRPIASKEIAPTDSIPATVGKEAYNLAIGIPNFIATPAGVATSLTGGAGGAIGKAIAATFSAQAWQQAGEALLSLIPNWHKLSTPEKTKAIVDVGGNTIFGTLMAKAGKTAEVPSGVRPEDIQQQTTGEQNASEITKPTGVSGNEIRQQLGQEAPLRQQGEVAQTQPQIQEQPSQQDIQSGINTPSGSGIPTRGIPAQPIPETVHAAPDIVQKIRGNKIKSPVALQRVFPGLNLSTAEAEDLLYQAWGKKTWKETVPAVENAAEPQPPVSEPITPPVKPQEAGTAPAAAPEPAPEVISDTRTKLAGLAKGMIPVRTAKSAADLSQTAAENGFEELPEDEKAKYSPTTKASQIRKVSDLIGADIENARAIVRGEKPVPSNIKGQVLWNAMEKIAMENSDVGMINELVKSPLAAKRSIAAQELGASAFNQNPHSPAEAVREITEAREKDFQKKTGQVPEVAKKRVVDTERNRMNGEIKLSASRRPDWETFISQIACRN